MNATISADHRVTDGAEAAQFMQRFKEILEEPMRLISLDRCCRTQIL
jgi:pyruvate dehydrogenase E2 component (dihydrolipoamide acetyltransferase)